MLEDELQEKIAAKTQARDKAEDDARLATNAASEARQRATNNGHCANDINRARGGLVAILGSDQTSEPIDSLLAKGIALVEDVQPLTQSLNNARSDATAAERKSRQAYARVEKVARSDAFAAALPALAAQFSRNTFETACEDRAGLTQAIGQQIAATKSARDAVQADFDACLSELQGFCNDALDALKAATRKRLPDSVPHYGGKEVLLMKSIATTMTSEVRRGMLEGYLKNLIADNRIPENGAHLAADAVVTLHGGQPLGLKLIRVTQHARLDYDDIAKISSSGGEKVTAAMLLYFVIVKLRAENRARRADGGPLILDNPFAKMNMESLWRAVRSLADAVGVQCIFATILEDKNALSVFDKLIELRAGAVNRRTDRRHVEAADVTFKTPIAA
jgi:DNA repair exonuclease SbcCD ATPase subunit